MHLLNHEFKGLPDDTPTPYYQWAKGDNVVVEKKLVQSDLKTAQAELMSQLQNFLRHIYNARHQQ